MRLRQYISREIRPSETKYLLDNRSELTTERAQLPKCFLKDSREREESKCVPCRCRIEDDNGVLHRLNLSESRKLVA